MLLINPPSSETSAKKHDGVDTVFTILVDQILQRPQVFRILFILWSKKKLHFVLVVYQMDSIMTNHRPCYISFQLWECESQTKGDGGQDGVVLRSLGGQRSGVECCIK